MVPRLMSAHASGWSTVTAASRAPARVATPLWVALAWIERHCVVPDGPRRGEPFTLYAFQGDYLREFYRVRPDAEVGQLATAFVNRRGLLVGPQGIGKNPMTAAHCCLEGVGPSLFGGFAGSDDGYTCADHGCRCGWEFAYKPGEPMGQPRPTPLIQVTAFTQKSTDNTYDALRPMIELGPLADLIPWTGEDFIRLPGGGRIDTITSSHRARLGNRVTFAPQDEVGLYTPSTGMVALADTQYRNLSKMGGRASLTSNAWDPAQHSVAQREFESGAADILRQFTQPPVHLSFGNKVERRKIFAAVYPRDVRRTHGGHLDIDAIEAEAVDLWRKDPAQAERYYGNRLVVAQGRAFDLDRWSDLAAPRPPSIGLVTLGFDGSRFHDTTALVATDVASGYQFPLGIWQPDGERGIPLEAVDAAVITAFETLNVWRLYADPPYWESMVSSWAGRWGAERVVEWWTNRPKAMAHALAAWSGAMAAGEVSHCPASEPLCRVLSAHIGNAVRHETGYVEDGLRLWTVEKPHPLEKIDAAVAAALSWEARNDAIAAGALNVEAPFTSIYETRGLTFVGGAR